VHRDGRHDTSASGLSTRRRLRAHPGTDKSTDLDSEVDAIVIQCDIAPDAL
jgi:hypothetical protein